MTYALGRSFDVQRHAVRARDRQGRREERLPLFVPRARHRAGVPPFQRRRAESMIVSRRRPSPPHRCLRGLGVDRRAAAARRMVPAATALAQTAGGSDMRGSASSTCRTASIMRRVDAAQEGADFEFSPILKPLGTVPRARQRLSEPLELRSRPAHSVSSGDVAQRHASAAQGQPAQARHDGRPGDRAEDRPRHHIPVDGARDRGSLEPSSAPAPAISSART